MKTTASMTLATLLIVGCATAPATPPGAKPDPLLAQSIASPARTPAFVARDAVRHPLEELTFLQLKPGMTVVELWPGGGYWTEILAPYLAATGHYYAALPPAEGEEGAGIPRWRARVAGLGERAGTVHETTLGPGQFEIAPPNSADLVLTFRNFHNWMADGYAEQALAACFKALKPGGLLGIEDHRGRDDQPQDPKAKSGYVRQDYMIALAKRAGFVFVGSSEIDANPRDTKDWVGGVWTLPPTLSQKDQDRERYLAIGEADNFVLEFRKPRH
jgi:predicted methyltransferase